MYFSLLPDVQYDKKPISYPFSEADYVTAKNFFRRWKINEKVFDSVVYYKKYTIQDGDRPDTIANDLYDNPFYDWIIILTNNIINPTFNWPMSEYQLRKYVESQYKDAYRDIVQYRTISAADQKRIFGDIIIEPDKVVDKKFYDSYTTWTWQNPPDKVLEIDLTDSDNFSSFGKDTGIVPTGTGTGASGGFNIGPHLKIGTESSNPGTNPPGGSPRIVTLKPIDLSKVLSMKITAVIGNGKNGGETPDAFNEDLYLRVYNSNGTMVSSFIFLSIQNQGSPVDQVLNEFTVNVPVSAQIPDATLEFYQGSNSGTNFDHYGLTKITDGSNKLYKTYEIINEKNVVVDGVLYQYVIDESTGQERWGIKNQTGYKFYDPSIGRAREVSGDSISYPITAFEYESEKNEKNREIYLLKKELLTYFIEEFKSNNLYKTSNDFVSSRLKKTGD